jgi:hypothetical protein
MQLLKSRAVQWQVARKRPTLLNLKSNRRRKILSLLNRPQAAGKQPNVASDAILQHLTSSQHLHPHRAVQQVLDETTESLGCCPNAIARGIEWMDIEPARAIGRLRRSELVQLAKAVHRFWMQNIEAAAEDSR